MNTNLLHAGGALDIHITIDTSAYQNAHQLNKLANTSGYISTAIKMLFPLPKGQLASLAFEVTSLYFSSIASSLNYNASLPGNGVILDINYFGII